MKKKLDDFLDKFYYKQTYLWFCMTWWYCLMHIYTETIEFFVFSEERKNAIRQAERKIEEAALLVNLTFLYKHFRRGGLWVCCWACVPVFAQRQRLNFDIWCVICCNHLGWRINCTLPSLLSGTVKQLILCLYTLHCKHKISSHSSKKKKKKKKKR